MKVLFICHKFQLQFLHNIADKTPLMQLYFNSNFFVELIFSTFLRKTSNTTGEFFLFVFLAFCRKILCLVDVHEWKQYIEVGHFNCFMLIDLYFDFKILVELWKRLEWQYCWKRTTKYSCDYDQKEEDCCCNFTPSTTVVVLQIWSKLTSSKYQSGFDSQKNLAKRSKNLWHFLADWIGTWQSPWIRSVIVFLARNLWRVKNLYIGDFC